MHRLESGECVQVRDDDPLAARARRFQEIGVFRGPGSNRRRAASDLRVWRVSSLLPWRFRAEAPTCLGAEAKPAKGVARGISKNVSQEGSVRGARHPDRGRPAGSCLPYVPRRARETCEPTVRASFCRSLLPFPKAQVKREDSIRKLFLLAARYRCAPRSAGGSPAPAAETGFQEGLSPRDWEDAAALARRVGQEPIFLAFAKEHPGAPISPATWADLETQSRYHAFRWEELRESAEAALKALVSAGIRPLLLKGLACVGEYYECPAWRPMRDLDVLVPPEDIARAEEALREAGFRDGEEGTWNAAEHHHLPPLFHESTGACVELHYRIAPRGTELGDFPAAQQVVRSRTGPSALFGAWADRPDPTGLVLVSCIHLTYADKLNRRAQNLVDLLRVLEMRGREVDWDLLLRSAGSAAEARSLSVPFEYLAREGAPSAPEGVRAELRRRARLRSWELGLLNALTNRYRLGSPPPWRFISGRVANILWSHMLERKNPLLRLLRAAAEAARR